MYIPIVCERVWLLCAAMLSVAFFSLPGSVVGGGG